MKFRSTLAAAVVLAMTACGEAPAANGKPAPAHAHAASAAAKPTEAAAVSNKNVPADVAKTITSKLESRYADRKLKVEEIAAAPVTGWYEVVVNGKNLVYVDASAEYMLVGDLISTQDGKSLTEERKAVLNKIDYDKLPFDKAIKEVRGNGKLQVAVFSDPDCPFCKKLEHEFGKMTDITIYNFMMPIPQLHPDAARKAVQIMCQPNTTKAWIEWMREGKMPASVAECANHVAETTALGESFGFNGTPTIVFPNGQVQSGFAPLPQLEEVIKANQK